ncbi:MAG: MBOAT family protein [Desulfacinum sp.]|jgi:D-alanyl-lipoteichoic acid acyltransferase DltB (MBOAT superfamily)|nr:MBOAT family protein [Desulfacinum sp.]
MLFNSFEFFAFYLAVFLLYKVLPARSQNLMLLVASYFFYGCWNWRLLSLMLVSTLVAYVAGLGIERSSDEKTKKRYLLWSAASNLAILGFFKYFNFFAESLKSMLQTLGWENFGSSHFLAIDIVLPVGISFYTFQAMSYAVDVYRKQVRATSNFLDLALFVSFFPQLVAGPIERAKHLLPQVQGKRRVQEEDYHLGLWLILWGLFKKVAIADNVAPIVDAAFGNASALQGPEVVLAAYAFAVQIYCDFSGYSDIARGTARLLGFDIMVNFRLPFLAKNPSDFWRRWHISLSTWLRDYLYIPLGGNRKGRFMTYRNLMITMVLGGLWHGAAWNFVIWGFYQGALLAVHRAFSEQRKSVVGWNRWHHVLQVFLTFQLMAVGWLIFRAENFQQLSTLFHKLLFNWSAWGDAASMAKSLITYSWPLILVQAFQQRQGSLFPQWRWPRTARAALYGMLLYIMFVYGATQGQEFIYFQF